MLRKKCFENVSTVIFIDERFREIHQEELQDKTSRAKSREARGKVASSHNSSCTMCNTQRKVFILVAQYLRGNTLNETFVNLLCLLACCLRMKAVMGEVIL